MSLLNKAKSSHTKRVERKCGRYMERKIVFLPGEISHSKPNIYSDVEVECEKSADAIVVMDSHDEGLNVK